MFSEKKSVLKMTLRSWPLPQAQCLAVRIRPSPIRVPVHTFMLLVISPTMPRRSSSAWLHSFPPIIASDGDGALNSAAAAAVLAPLIIDRRDMHVLHDEPAWHDTRTSTNRSGLGNIRKVKGGRFRGTVRRFLLMKGK